MLAIYIAVFASWTQITSETREQGSGDTVCCASAESLGAQALRGEGRSFGDEPLEGALVPGLLKGRGDPLEMSFWREPWCPGS